MLECAVANAVYLRCLGSFTNRPNSEGERDPEMSCRQAEDPIRLSYRPEEAKLPVV